MFYNKIVYFQTIQLTQANSYYFILKLNASNSYQFLICGIDRQKYSRQSKEIRRIVLEIMSDYRNASRRIFACPSQIRKATRNPAFGQSS